MKETFWDKQIYYFLSTILVAIAFIALDWSVDGFQFYIYQEQSHFFQAWVSYSGIAFSLLISLTAWFIYRKTKLPSLKLVPLSFLLSAIAYFIIGYHASYCEVCSNLSYCAASHNYPNLLFLFAMVVFMVHHKIAYLVLDKK